MITYIVTVGYGYGVKFTEYSGSDPAAAVAKYDQLAAEEGAHVTMRAVGPAPGQFEVIHDSDEEAA